MILSVENISKYYQQGEVGIHALKNINFHMNEGETLAIIGSSGSGKTTLLSLIAGLDEPTSGQVLFSGKNITQLDEKQISEFRARNMGIIFQQFHLMPYLTALENIALPLEILGDSNVEQRAKDALESVGLEKRANHRPDQLSGGEKQRVAIARALVIEPRILLADEPSGNLDTETGSIVMNLLFDLVKKNQMTLILVTHNLQQAQLCQRTIELRAGQVQ